MRDEIFQSESTDFRSDQAEPAGTLKRALYLWERQPPVVGRPHLIGPHDPDPPQKTGSAATPEIPPDGVGLNDETQTDPAIEDRLRDLASRLAALERVIPGERRLDSPRFSLMMLNAFLGRAVTDGAVLARLPGLFSIADRIDGELADLESEYPAALEPEQLTPNPTPDLLQHDIRRLIADLNSTQKAQQRQIVSSLSALHAAISEIRAHLPDRLVEPNTEAEKLEVGTSDRPYIPPMPRIDDVAQPLIDADKLVDPRPVLAAARAAAARVNIETVIHPQQDEIMSMKKSPDRRTYGSVLLGSACLGILMILFGRDAVQFLSSSPLSQGLARP